MVEAAMVLPIFILIVFSLILVMVFYYENHHQQMEIHRCLLEEASRGEAAFRVRRQSQQNQKSLSGIIRQSLTYQKTHRIYMIRPANWIRMGEMAGVNDG